MRNEPEAIPEGMCSDVDLEVPSLSDFLLLVSADELLHEQQSDTIKETFDCVLSTTEINSAAGGYFLQNGLLL